jgi:hypothetical protein
LPIPGSPPTSRADPVTKPPPVTLSNSAMPVSTRGAPAVSPFSVESATTRPLRGARDAGPAATPPDTPASSTSVFHSPHSSQRPCQRVETAPQFWQTN